MLVLIEETLSGVTGTFKELGLLGGLVVLLLFAVWSVVRGVASWVKPHLDKLITAHVSFLERTSTAVDALQQTTSRQQALMETHADRLNEIEKIARSQVHGGPMVEHWNKWLGTIHDDVKDTKETVTRIEGKLKP